MRKRRGGNRTPALFSSGLVIKRRRRPRTGLEADCCRVGFWASLPLPLGTDGEPARHLASGRDEFARRHLDETEPTLEEFAVRSLEARVEPQAGRIPVRRLRV